LSEEEIQVQLRLKEIYEALCPKCKKKIRKLIKEKITDDMVNRVLGVSTDA